ncbi:DNA mismatch repair protein MLH3 [Castanea sativa]|uniref:DNA mismatch repair protein MLH3 n=1 Tax=Castanea sativa TaxID=21020 RepID=UPI003F64ED15
MRSINPLPEAVRSSVRSGIILFDITRVVEELVFNSLDASATKVSVYVGVSTCYVKVEDDGSGVTRDGLVLLGERYATSKFHQLADMDTASGCFGYRGEALASISDVSLLEIVTKAYGRPNGYRKVIKGCKCLYLEIDDGRKNVGTTVTVRDLFYNQPVRRKYMQSSPKKVLHSVKKCVLRIALVYSQVSFKVVDSESGDELLCTHPSSPLSLLTSGFGIEVSDSLHELNASDGILKLSGFISGPCDGFGIKAFQYVYINSRFVCKGPIHKLLNQLATRFECLDSWAVNDGSQNRKRSRSQAYPAYILNLICPRSLYDLTFEPSKTYVEFKDWGPILAFTEKAIQRFWKDNLAFGESISHATDIIRKDKMWREVDDIISAEEDFLEVDLSKTSEIAKKKCRIQNHKASIDIFSSPSEMLTKEVNHLSHTHNRIPSGNLQKISAEFKEQQVEMGFVCQKDFALQSWDGLEAKSIPTVSCRYDNHLLKSDNNSLSVEDHFLENRFDDNVEENSLSSACGVQSLNVVPDVNIESAGRALSCDYFSRDIKRPLLQGCSSQQRLPLERSLFANDEGFEFQRNGSMTDWKQAGAHDRVDILEVEGSNHTFDFLSRNLWQDEASCSQPFTREITKCELPRDFDFPSRAFVKSVPSFGEHFIENVLESDSLTQIENFGSGKWTSNSDWCCPTSDPLFQATPWDVEHFKDKNAPGVSSHSGESTRYGHFVDDRKRGCKSSYDIMSKVSSLENSTSSCTYSKLEFNGISDSSRDFCKFLQIDNQDCRFPDMLPDETDWLYLNSCAKDKDIDKYEGQRDSTRYQDCEQDHVPKERSRSHSAPPFYRRKRRFFSLNHPEGKPDAKTFDNALTYPEADKLKHAKQPSGISHLISKPNSVEHLLSETRPDMEKMAGISDLKKIEGEKYGQSHYLDIQDTIPVKVSNSKETQDSMDSWSKWQNCSSQITNKNRSRGIHDESKILDISSGFLHLASDSLIPKSINKNCLGNAKVLQQVDKKFIPVVAGGILAVIDQHAADERIRLEELRKKVLSGEAKTTSYLDVEQELMLPENAHQLLEYYAEEIKDWGWICNIHGQDSRSFKRNLNILHRRPTAVTLIAVPNILGVNLSDVDLLEFLQQLADTDGSSTIPPSVLRILNMKACRGAIMFGDSLLLSECSLIVEELKKTSLCFQCAHGRPTTVPLVNLEALRKQVAKVGFLGDSSSELWHGLCRQKFSIERAAQRLSSARG